MEISNKNLNDDVRVQMGSISKHQARDKDRISALPDALVYHILSFLPTTNVVRTTVLSKRWNKMWTSVTNLDFDDERDFCTKKESQQLFANFVNRVLLFRGEEDIYRFRLAVNHPYDLSHIDSWICTAVWRNAVELDFVLSLDCTGYFSDSRKPFYVQNIEGFESAGK